MNNADAFHAQLAVDLDALAALAGRLVEAVRANGPDRPPDKAGPPWSGTATTQRGHEYGPTPGKGSARVNQDFILEGDFND